MIQLRILSLILCLLFISCGSQRISKDFTEKFNLSKSPAKFIIPEIDSSYYENCVERLSNEGMIDIDKIDYLKFRYNSLKNPNSTSPNFKLENELGEAFQKQDWKSVIEISDKIQKENYVHVRSHVLKGYALKQLGKDGTLNALIGGKLCNSILSTGNGESPNTAFYVINVEEEYELLKYLQLDFISYKTINIDGKSLDVLLCRDDKRNKYEVYFDFMTLPLSYSR